MSGATSHGSSANGPSLKYLCPSSGQRDTTLGTLSSEQNVKMCPRRCPCPVSLQSVERWFLEHYLHWTLSDLKRGMKVQKCEWV